MYQNFKKAILSVCFLSMIGFLCAVSNVYSSSITDNFNEQQAKINADFKGSKAKQNKQFKHLQQAYLKQLNEAKKSLAPKWDDPTLTSKHVWVEYSNSDNIRRSVDYKTGEISIEILGDNISKAKINQVVSNQLLSLKKESTNNATQKDKVITASDKKIAKKIPTTQKMMPALNIKSLKQQAKVSTSLQKNGQKLTKITMRNTKNHIVKRGDTYLPLVFKNAKKWHVEPSLILAIMYTESHFNPLAQSHIPAYGLMQVVPTSAGRDVTSFYMGGERILRSGELFDPTFNINVGTAYLNILESKYLKRVSNKETRMYLAIAAYNGGIGAVAKHFSGKSSLSALAVSVNRLTPEQVYESLKYKFPAKETTDYLVRVSQKEEYYRSRIVK